jgi:short subunit dehydrogenase-like uncharacterized protein
MKVLLYGVTGYTGMLVARAIAARGVPQVVAGRRRDAVDAAARALSAESRAFGLDAPDLRGVDAVINCAGPFARTAPPLVEAAIAAGVHYLDLAGEAPEHEAVRQRGTDAAARGVMLMPGVGFGVVPTDCAAALACRALPSAQRLTIAYETVGGASRGTLETVLGGLDTEGFRRVNGALVAAQPAERVIDLDLGDGATRVATNPYRADLVSAFATTGVGDIETYATFPAPLRALMRSNARRWPIVRRAINAVIARAPEGPTEKQRREGSTRVVAIAEDGERTATALVRGPEAYEFTARAAGAIAARIAEAQPGYRTPSQVFGPELLASLLTGPGESVEVRA